MKLLINTESLRPPVTGIGNYTLNLLQQFCAMGDFDSIECFSGRHITSASGALAECEAASLRHLANQGAPLAVGNGRLGDLLRRSTLAYRAREALRNALLRLKAAQLRDFTYHEPNFILKDHKGPSVATIHDLSFIHYPQLHPSKRVEWLTSELPKTVARADFLITDSEQIRNELIEHFAVDEQRVRTIHLGAAACYGPKSPEQTQGTLARHGLRHGQYLLFVGTLEPRKGVDILLDTLRQLPPALTREFPLVLAGAPGWNNQALQKDIAELIETRGLRHLNFVAGQDLPALYAGARVFVYPSRYEGFGLPVLEAMRSGTPVICTANTSMSEITGDSALLIEEGNAQQLTALLRELLDDEARQRTLATAGLLRARDFSWEKCAKQTQEIYRLAQARHSQG